MKGIYRIRNTLNNNSYIGSSKDLDKRFKTHIRTLRNFTHHNIYLQRAFNKYGEDAFVFECLEEVDSVDDLFKREEYYINSISPEYNIGAVGGGDNITLNPNYDLIVRKISKSLIGRKCKPKYGSDNLNWRGGVGSCSSCGSTLKRNNKSGFCNKCRPRDGELNSFYGKSHSVSTKEKQSNRMKGYKPTNMRKVLINEVEFESVTSAARELKVSPALIIYRIKSDKYVEYSYVV